MKDDVADAPEWFNFEDGGNTNFFLSFL